jgi:hypothetical protein
VDVIVLSESKSEALMPYLFCDPLLLEQNKCTLSTHLVQTLVVGMKSH